MNFGKLKGTSTCTVCGLILCHIVIVSTRVWGFTVHGTTKVLCVTTMHATTLRSSRFEISLLVTFIQTSELIIVVCGHWPIWKRCVKRQAFSTERVGDGSATAYAHLFARDIYWFFFVVMIQRPNEHARCDRVRETELTARRTGAST